MIKYFRKNKQNRISLKFRNSSIIFFLILLISVSVLRAQNIRFNHLSIKDGLSQNSVTCIFQDKKGFMWFGTQDGLNRYDGYNFKVFRNDPENKNSLTDNFIFSIHEDNEANLYVRTISNTLHRFLPLTESFEVINEDSINLFSTRYNSVLSFYYDKDSVEWIGGASRGTGLKRIDRRSGQEHVFMNEPGINASISSNKVYSVLRDSKNNLWIGTTDGLNKLNETTNTFEHFRNNANDPNSISNNWVWPICEDSRGNIWIGTVNGGLNKFEPTKNRFTSYKNIPSDPSSISDNFIFSIYEDRGGVIWIGTNNSGVNYFNPSEQAFGYNSNVEGDYNTISNNNVLSIYVDKKGDYWFGTSAGLDKLDNTTGKYIHYSAGSGKIGGLVDNPIQLIFEDNEATLWLGTFNGGLVEFNKRTGASKLHVHESDKHGSISDNRIYSICQSKDGLIWVGTYGGGLNSFNKRTGRFSQYVHDESDSNSLSGNSVWSVTEDHKGDLWIGVYGGGINIFNREKKVITKQMHDANRSESLSSNDVIKIFRDSKENVWIGTMVGLNKYIEKTNSFKYYTEKDGLCNNVIFGIVEDNAGFLWLSTYSGLSKFDPVSEKFQNFYYHDGLQSNDFNQNAYAKDNKTGMLLFGGPNGFNVFHPDSIKENKLIPPVVFTDYRRYNTDDAEGKAIIEHGISERKEITLTHKDNIVSFAFSALSYYNNFMNKYRYKLEGFNENWIQLDDNHNVTFTNLAAGNYNLRVIGSNNNGLWNDTGASLNITIDPPWYGTNLAYVLYFFAGFGFLFGVRRFEINRREQKAFIRETELLITASESEKRALRVENERKTKELEEARSLQLSMLPDKLPELENLDISVFMRTATEVGGDYYDFSLNGSVLNVALGDATGHGLQAGTMVTLMKGFFTSLAANMDIQSFMTNCNNSLKDIKMGRIHMAFTLMKIEGNKVSFSSAAMPPVFIFRKAQGIVEEIVMKGMPFGAMKNFPFKTENTLVNEGDIILLLSDGLPEQLNPGQEMFDYNRVSEQFLAASSGNSGDIINQLVRAGDEWRAEESQADDISILVIKII